MKFTFNNICFFILSTILTSCATVNGGSSYYANIKIPGHPKAKIEYKGQILGTGEASVRIKRVDADKVSITVKEEGFTDQSFSFRSKSLRGWALIASGVFFTGAYSGIPLPWGLAIDFASGAAWRPDIYEKGIYKKDVNDYDYILEYNPTSLTSEKQK